LWGVVAFSLLPVGCVVVGFFPRLRCWVLSRLLALFVGSPLVVLASGRPVCFALWSLFVWLCFRPAVSSRLFVLWSLSVWLLSRSVAGLFRRLRSFLF
jgi:hypothetical protein